MRCDSLHVLQNMCYCHDRLTCTCCAGLDLRCSACAFKSRQICSPRPHHECHERICIARVLFLDVRLSCSSYLSARACEPSSLLVDTSLLMDTRASLAASIVLERKRPQCSHSIAVTLCARSKATVTLRHPPYAPSRRSKLPVQFFGATNACQS